MKLFDMHCDTPLELHLKKQHIDNNTLHVSLDKAADFEKYIQCAAVWSDKGLSDRDCLNRFFKAADYLKSEMQRFGVAPVTSRSELDVRRGIVLTVEGARLICGELSNIEALYDAGVRIMTLVWKDEDSVGGAWNTDMGLTPLGYAVTEKCIDVGIIPDISHGSQKLVSDVLDIMHSHGKMPLATHSNAYSVCGHPRNLSDDNIKRIAHMGGLCGISLCTEHLSPKDASVSDILLHIDKYIDLGGRKNVCFGCDFDGIDKTPEGITDISSMKILFDAVSHRYGESAAEDIFYNNAYNYMKNNLPTS